MSGRPVYGCPIASRQHAWINGVPLSTCPCIGISFITAVEGHYRNANGSLLYCSLVKVATKVFFCLSCTPFSLTAYCECPDHLAGSSVSPFPVVGASCGDGHTSSTDSLTGPGVCDCTGSCLSIIHHSHHTVGYAIPPHSSVTPDNDSTSSWSA